MYRVMKKWKPLHIAGGNIKWCTTLRIILAVSQNVNQTIVRASNSTPRYQPKRNKILCSTSVFIAALLIIAKHWRKPTCPSTGEWISKLWHIHTVEYCSVMKSNEVLTHTTAWWPSKHYAKWKTSKRAAEGHILYDSLTLNVQNRQTYRDKE